ncbi:MurR/RpiR family transcriptional regulator [Butyrivibrio sp. YAB3001]|uniref:MurR/RpiR family transcriptional regulator n=1 Tax=Butyrivibrio sp. YAB3001 TaxID=1520812 RepID=UPI0008F68FFD|nr:MurR/RpiR family transcriptional regulator [Butyrivibrio sp. YAB3001]SFC84372.1 transcriptional regulator, RpiR family [Butyrivibrio sp. YAB3001]
MNIVSEKIKSCYDNLPAAERMVADFVLERKDDLFQYPIKELARLSGTTQAAWTRFAQAIGYSGLKELKNAYYSEANVSLQQADKGGPKIAFKDVNEYTSLQSIADNICATSVQAIQTTYRLFDTGTFSEVVTRIVSARQIQVFGVGTAGVAAYDFYCKLLRIHYNVVFNQDHHMNMMTVSQIGPDDVAIFFVDNAKNKEIMQIFNIAKEKEAVTLAVTKLGNNPLTTGCDYVLFTTSPEIDKKSGVTSSRFAQLFMVDTLYTAIANRDYDNIRGYLHDSYEVFHESGRE